MKIKLLFLLLVLTKISYGQVKDYNTYVSEADSLMAVKEYKNAASKFSEAFKTNNWRGTIAHRYSAARAWALSGIPDSAFFHLNKIASNGLYVDYEQLLEDIDLGILHKDSRWEPLTKSINQNQLKAEPNLDRKLARKLDSIHTNDQQYRLQLIAAEKKHGKDSKEVTALWKVIKTQDSINLAKVTAIIDQRGWLGKDVIGQNGNSTLFLVIQHSNLPTMVKYLPKIREAVKASNASASSLALMEDRVNIFQGKKQIYGSQISFDQKTGKYTVSPVEDPDHIDERRSKAGLNPMAEYVSQWQIKWNPQDYK
ncbi:MAG: DUF6624 domain-containing protein [Bacteroidota bacterium]